MVLAASSVTVVIYAAITIRDIPPSVTSLVILDGHDIASCPIRFTLSRAFYRRLYACIFVCYER